MYLIIYLHIQKIQMLDTRRWTPDSDKCNNLYFFFSCEFRL